MMTDWFQTISLDCQEAPLLSVRALPVLPPSYCMSVSRPHSLLFHLALSHLCLTCLSLFAALAWIAPFCLNTHSTSQSVIEPLLKRPSWQRRLCKALPNVMEIVRSSVCTLVLDSSRWGSEGNWAPSPAIIIIITQIWPEHIQGHRVRPGGDSMSGSCLRHLCSSGRHSTWHTMRGVQVGPSPLSLWGMQWGWRRKEGGGGQDAPRCWLIEVVEQQEHTWKGCRRVSVSTSESRVFELPTTLKWRNTLVHFVWSQSSY